MIVDYASMTDDELFAEIERQYGEDWQPGDLENNPELAAALMERIGTGY